MGSKVVNSCSEPPTYHCQDEVDKKYGGPGFRTWQGQQYDEPRARVQQARIDNIVNSGPISLVGRGLGYGAGYLISGKEDGGRQVSGLSLLRKSRLLALNCLRTCLTVLRNRGDKALYTLLIDGDVAAI